MTYDPEKRVLTSRKFEEMMEKQLLALGRIADVFGDQDAIDMAATACINGENTTQVFWTWYNAVYDGTTTRYALLCRFAELVATAWQNKTYGLQWYHYTQSSATEMTPTGDLAGKAAAQLCTEATTPVADWADEDPMTWYIRANALSLADGTMNILAFEGESDFDLTGETAPVYRFSLALYKRTFNDGAYNYKAFRTKPALGFEPMAGDISPAGTRRPVTWQPCFGGGMNTAGKLTSGVGRKPYIFASATDGNTKAKLWNSYEGLWTDCESIWLLDMWQLRHFNMENSGICEGCTSYDIAKKAAVSETGVKRVVLNTSDASGFLVGSAVSIGSSSRASGNSIYKITSITDVTISSTAYKAINLDVPDGSEFDTTAATTYISTVPWFSGATEALPGHKDGCINSLTAGKGPARIAGVEILDGAYVLQLDPLMNVTSVNSDGAVYDLYVQRNSENLASAVTNYTKVGSVTVPICNNAPSSGEWIYVKQLLDNKEVMFPDQFAGDASSTKYLKSAFIRAASAGVRAPWRFGNLNNGGNAGLAYLNGNNSPGNSNWNSRPRIGKSEAII